MKETKDKMLYTLVWLSSILLSLVQCRPPESTSVDWSMNLFVKVDSVNPVLGPGKNEFVCPVLGINIGWDEKDVFNPAAVVRDGKVYLIFRAEDHVGKYAGTSRIGLAESDDG